MQRSAAYIDLDSLKNNYEILKSIGASAYKVMAVVKANAYGHGSVPVSKHLESIGCNSFGVASFEEADELRENGISSDILIFGRTDPEYAIALSSKNIIQTIPSLEYALELSKQNYPINVHINVDTGMSRFGIYCHNESDITLVADEIKKISELPNLRIIGIYTHFEGAENPDSTNTKKQFALFSELLNELKNRKIEVGTRHVCNSSATILYPEMHLDMVRCGIALYGYPPIQNQYEFKTVMTVKSKVVSIQELKPGDTVSYGARFKADKKIQIGTIAIGYADGYPRVMSNNDYMVFNKNFCRVLGTVCMDATMIEITGSKIKIGDEIEVFGKNKSVEIIARKSNTITYEILCNVGKRVERIYTKTSR